jgi:hypothetical protein
MKSKTFFLLLLFIQNSHLPEKTLTYSEVFFLTGVACGEIDRKLREVSGIVASINNPGFLWAINDSGNLPEIFLITTKAEVKRVWHLKGCDNIDWEDISIGIDPATKKVYLYIGDIGDNFANRATKIVYKIEEPILESTDEINEVEKLVIGLSDGNRDMEAMMFDPISNTLFFISKREHSVGLYSIPHLNVNGSIRALKLTSLPFTNIVAANISPSGQHVIIKDYKNVFYWERSSCQSISELLHQPPIVLPYDPEIQGEAVCFALDESGYFTLSESSYVTRAKLFFYKKNVIEPFTS